MGIPLSLAAGIGTLVLLHFYIRKWVNKLTRQNGNIAGRIFYLLSSNKHSSKFLCKICTTELENKLCNYAPTVKELLLPLAYSNMGKSRVESPG